jgi:hypothetical protein
MHLSNNISYSSSFTVVQGPIYINTAKFKSNEINMYAHAYNLPSYFSSDKR